MSIYGNRLKILITKATQFTAETCKSSTEPWLTEISSIKLFAAKRKDINCDVLANEIRVHKPSRVLVPCLLTSLTQLWQGFEVFLQTLMRFPKSLPSNFMENSWKIPTLTYNPANGGIPWMFLRFSFTETGLLHCLWQSRAHGTVQPNPDLWWNCAKYWRGMNIWWMIQNQKFRRKIHRGICAGIPERLRVSDVKSVNGFQPPTHLNHKC